MSNPNFVGVDMQRLAEAIRGLPPRVGRTVENFFKDRFREGGWRDKGFEKWAPRKVNRRKRDLKRATLVKSGALRRSVRTSVRGFNITTATSLPYAQIHNEGGKSEATDVVSHHSRQSHRRKGYTRADGRKIKAVQVKSHSVGTFTRKRKYDLPKRQFIGHSDALLRDVDRLIKTELDRAFKGK